MRRHLAWLWPCLLCSACLQDFEQFEPQDDAEPRAEAASEAEAITTETIEGAPPPEGAGSDDTVTEELQLGAQNSGGGQRGRDEAEASEADELAAADPEADEPEVEEPEVLPSESQADAGSELAPVPRFDGGQESLECATAACDATRNECDLACFRALEACELECTRQVKRCERECADVFELCGGDCVQGCDACYLEVGCAARCE